MFLLDNACYPYHVCNDVSWFLTIDYATTDSLDAVSSTPTEMLGLGEVPFTVYNEVTGERDRIIFTNVAYVPNQPHNLLSHTRLKEVGLNADYENLTLCGNDSRYRFSLEHGVFPFREVSDAPDNCAAAAMQHTHTARSDWQFSLSELDRHAKRYGDSFGSFTFESFRQEGNECLKDGTTAAFDMTWIGKCFYGNPVFDNDFIYRTLSKALHDLRLSPDNTKFFLLVPYWTDAYWWHLASPSYAGSSPV